MHPVQQPGITGLVTDYVVGHTTSFSGVINSMVVWVLERPK